MAHIGRIKRPSILAIVGRIASKSSDKVALLTVVILFNLTCQTDVPVYIQNELRTLDERVVTNLNDYTFIERGDILTIEFNRVSPYILLPETIDVLAMYIVYNLFGHLEQYNVVTIAFEFEDKSILEDRYVVIYTKDKRIALSKNMSGHDIFLNFIEYVINKVSDEDVIKYNVMLERIPEFVPGFPFKGTFWVLLQEYSRECSNNNKGDNTLYMKMLTDLVSIPGADANLLHLNYFLTECGHREIPLKSIN